MTSHTPKAAEPQQCGSIESDCTIYPTSDQYKTTLPWIIRDYKERGAFSGEQKRRLSEQFELDPDLTDLLSLYIGNCLDIETSAGFYSLTKSSAVGRGRTLVRTALRALKAGKSDDEVRPMLSAITGIFLDSPDGEDAASLIADKTADLKSTLRRLLENLDAVASKLPDDKRAGRDSRRILVVEHCCYVWEDSGRKITYTTFPANGAGDQRGGKLFDLIHSVVELVTHPNRRIPGETLRADVDKLIQSNGWNLPKSERPDFMKEEPVFGKTE